MKQPNTTKPMIAGWRLNHLQLTVARGTLLRDYDKMQSFYCGVLGFIPTRIDKFGSDHVFLATDPEGSQFLYIAEDPQPMQAHANDHLGFHLQCRADVDRVLAACKQVQTQDARMQIQQLEDLDLAETVTHAFYFKYLLPLWFDIQVIEHKRGFEPRRRWSFG